MDNSAPQSRKILKYLGIEGGLVLIVVAALAIFFLKPDFNLNFPKKQKAPADMNISKPVNNTISAQIHNDLKVAPQIVNIVISESGVDPASVQAFATGTVLRITNNTINKATVEFDGNLAPPVEIIPFGTWDSPNIVTKGTFKYTLKESSTSGSIVFK